MKNSNKPAFPISEETTDRIDSGVEIYTGITKREYFAGLAMQGFAANDVIGRNFNSKEAAERSIAWADELLRQLEK